MKGNRGKIRKWTLVWPCTKLVERSHEVGVAVFWNQAVRTDENIRKNKPDIVIRILMFFWPCIMNWLYINYQLDALIIIYSQNTLFLCMFRASSAHLQEDIVVYMQHLVPSLSIRVLVACRYASRVRTNCRGKVVGRAS